MTTAAGADVRRCGFFLTLLFGLTMTGTMRERNAFAENLIKGRIAETIFELMFREATAFDVYPLGYEHTIPILAQSRDHPDQANQEAVTRVADNLHTTPDFLLTLPDKTQVYLVEVKYRREATKRAIVSIAKKIHARWHPVMLFVATQKAFYFDACQHILEQEDILPLAQSLIPKETQSYYLELLRRFEQ